MLIWCGPFQDLQDCFCLAAIEICPAAELGAVPLVACSPRSFLPAFSKLEKTFPGIGVSTLAPSRNVDFIGISRIFSTLAKTRYREGSKIQLVLVSSAFPEGARVE